MDDRQSPSPPRLIRLPSLTTPAHPPDSTQTIGLLVASCVVQGTKDIDSAACYQIPVGIQFVWAAVLAGGLACLPESPRYLISRGKDAEAQRALARIYASEIDGPQVAEDYAEIAAGIHAERSRGKTTYLDCFRNGEGRNGLRYVRVTVSSRKIDLYG